MMELSLLHLSRRLSHLETILIWWKTVADRTLNIDLACTRQALEV